MSNLKILVTITTVAIFCSCKKESVTQPLNNVLHSGGSWMISDFTAGFLLDSALTYNGYTLVFQSNGMIQVQGVADADSGKWETSNFDDRIFLLIDLVDDTPYLDARWQVIKITDTQIELMTESLFPAHMILCSSVSRFFNLYYRLPVKITIRIKSRLH